MQKRLAFVLLVICLCFPAVQAKPSVLLITIDTFRADHLRKDLTPGLLHLTAESVLFQEAITVSPLTMPSHASLLTGLLPMNHGVRDNSFFVLPQDVATYATLFKQKGYRTAAFVSSIVLDHRLGLNAGFDKYDDQFEPPERDSFQTLARAWDWASSAPQPFFLWIHLFDPHAPYQGSYEEEIRRVDQNLQHFFDQLKGQNLWKDLVVAVTSDHGESLGEHGEETHGFFLYDSTLRIPLILKAPGLKPRQFAFQVSLVDLMPTITEILDFSGSDLQEANIRPDGRGLRSALELNRDPQRTVYSETFLPKHQFNWSEIRSLRTPDWKFIQVPRPELYDLNSDQAENRNLWSSENETADRLSKRLSRLENSSRAREGIRKPNLIAERFMSIGYIGSAPPDSETESNSRADPKEKLDIYLLVMDALELSEMGQPAEALGKLEVAERKDPDVTQIHFLKGSILGGAGRFPEAIQALKRTLELNPRYVTGRFKLAQAYLATGQLKEAEETLLVAVEQDPENFRAFHNLAVIAVRRGDLAEAERLEEKAIAINESYYEAWNTLGAIQISSQRPGSARESLTKALSIQPESGQAYYNLSLAETALGDVTAAREAARKACELDSRYCRE